jgi:hypothetical protein
MLLANTDVRFIDKYDVNSASISSAYIYRKYRPISQQFAGTGGWLGNYGGLYEAK